MLVDNRQRFKRRLHPIPAPEFYVFYNGTETLPETATLRLRDAFIPARDGGHQDSPFDLRVMVYNLNKPNGNAAWELCKPLTEYNDFVKIIAKSSGTATAT